MKLSVASAFALVGSTAAYQAPTMTFSFGKAKKAAKAAPKVSRILVDQNEVPICFEKL